MRAKTGRADGDDDPYLGMRYAVEIQGLRVAGFSEVTGLQAEVETEDYHEGGRNTFQHVLPKAGSVGRLTLKRGMTDQEALRKWQAQLHEGSVERRTVRVELRDERGETARAWRFLDAYPVKWSCSDLNATSDAVAVETLEFAYTSMRGD